MTFERRAEILGPLARHVHVDDLSAFTAAFAEIRTTPGEAVLREGAANDALWVVAEGQFGIDIDRAALGEIGPGTVFGELSMLTGGTASATVRSAGRGLALRLDRSALGRLRAEYPGAEAALVRALAESLAVRVREGTAALHGVEEGKRGGIVGVLARLFGRTL
jgi:extracellular factor (EF) 3-hydroxypalmitic acid methyl ester biosynthesis protein